jgi:HSP20 family molecular chaperone IbpA
MAEKTVAATVAQETPTAEVTKTRERYITPPVDIYETSDGLVVTADIPGVAQEGLDVRVDNRVLTIQGRSRHVVSGEPIHREYELVHYFRQFELSDEVDVEKIAAELKHGVLTLHLTKAAAAKPRQIPVQVG